MGWTFNIILVCLFFENKKETNNKGKSIDLWIANCNNCECFFSLFGRCVFQMWHREKKKLCVCIFLPSLLLFREHGATEVNDGVQLELALVHILLDITNLTKRQNECLMQRWREYEKKATTTKSHIYNFLDFVTIHTAPKWAKPYDALLALDYLSLGIHMWWTRWWLSLVSCSRISYKYDRERSFSLTHSFSLHRTVHTKNSWIYLKRKTCLWFRIFSLQHGFDCFSPIVP